MTDEVIRHSGKFYQISNWFAWLLYINSAGKINLFKDKNDKTIYCSELGALAINSIYPDTFPKPNRTNPYDILSNQNMEIYKPLKY